MATITVDSDMSMAPAAGESNTPCWSERSNGKGRPIHERAAFGSMCANAGFSIGRLS